MLSGWTAFQSKQPEPDYVSRDHSSGSARSASFRNERSGLQLVYLPGHFVDGLVPCTSTANDREKEVTGMGAQALFGSSAPLDPSK